MLVLVALVFVALNGFFVAAEFSLVKLRALSSGKPADEGDALAKAVAQIDRYLSVTQLGITLASLGLGWIGEPAISDLVRHAVLSITGHEPGRAGETAVVVVAFSLLTFTHVLFGELLPKLVAIQRSEQLARAALLPLRITFWLLRPALFLLETSSKAILAALGMSLAEHSEAKLSEDEILGMIAVHTASQDRSGDKRELFQKMIRFGDRTARQAMIPRIDTVYLPIGSSGARALESFKVNQFSRVPLSRGDELDHVVGYLYWKDLLLHPDAAKLTTLESLKRDVLFIPESQSLVNVLREMQGTQTPFAVVVDEYGGASGILTMEDLLEHIVGSIRDELDDEAVRLLKRDDGTWEVTGSVLLDELREAGLAIDDDDRQETVSALCVRELRRFPRVGDVVALGGGKLEVTAVARRRVTRARVTPPAPASASETEK